MNSNADAEATGAYESVKPAWDRESLTLSVGKSYVRKFRRARGNDQIKILDAFQDANWPDTIKDPFKDEFKLKETVKSFNRGAKHAADSREEFTLLPGRTKVAWYFATRPPRSPDFPPFSV